jgi:UDP-N-acetyl-D-mannosaminuronic acid dehydrogenase
MTKTENIDYRKLLIEKIKNRESRLLVMGAGYVGLPTVALFAEAGFPSIVLDIRPDIIERINRGSANTNEPGLNDLVLKNVHSGRLEGRLNHQVDFSKVDIVLIAVQTPIDENKEPCLQYLQMAIEDVGKSIKPGMLVVLISTIPPKTIMNKVKPRLELLSKFKAEREFFLSYVPERIAPGKALVEFTEGTRIVGGIGKNSTEVTTELFKTICRNIIETDATTAEITKLAENTFRDVNIAFANELALLCEEKGIDVTNVIKSANTHPRVNIHMPGPGVGGPCLPKDPYFLVHESDLPHDLIKTARKMNDYMSNHMIQLIRKALKYTKRNMFDSRIAILGVAYKSDTDDSRLSSAYPIINTLLGLGAEVTVYDSWCRESFGAQRKTSLQEAVQGADCLVIITNHTEFLKLNLKEIKSLMNPKPAIIDGRRIVNPTEAEKTGFSYYGLGLGMPNHGKTR